MPLVFSTSVITREGVGGGGVGDGVGWGAVGGVKQIFKPKGQCFAISK